MAFDAGAIIAHLEIDQQRFNKDLDDAERRVDKFAKTRKVHLQADFDSSALPRARKFFSDLDKAATLDAIQRSRSGNGSLLGTLMGLTSGHQIPGMPTGTQAARQGSIGQILRVPVQAVAPDKNSIGQAIAAATGGKQAAAAASTAGDDAGKSFSQHFKDSLSKAGIGGFLGGLLGSGGGKGGGLLGKLLAGAIGGGTGGNRNLLTGILGGIGPAIPGVGLKASGIVAGGGSLLGALPALLGGLSPLLAAAPGLAGIAALAKGAISNIQPLTQLASQIQNQQAAGLGSTAAGAKQIAQEQAQLAAGLQGLTGPQKQLFNSIQNIQNAWQNLTTSFTPLMAKALGSVAKLFQQLMPQLNSFFQASGDLMAPLIGGLGDIAKQLLPLFTQGIRAAIPVIRPLLDGLGSLVANIFPGLIVLVRASAPAVTALAQVLGGLGKDIGGLFAALAPGLKASGPILKALFDLLGALFPIIGKLATIMAQALGPVFVSFSSVIKSLLPVLSIIGQVFGALAGAILGDLVSAFGALAMLLRDVSPALQVLAKALEQAFNVLENAGVFAILGNTLEAVVPLVAKLVNTLVGGLAPILPTIIGLVSNLAGIAVKLLADGLAVVLPIATQLLADVLVPLVPVINAILPVITAMATLLGTGLAAVLKVIAPLLATIAPYVLIIIAAVKAWAIAQGILDIALNANPIGLIALAIAGLIIGITELVTHWKTVWTDIKAIGLDAWHFLDNAFHNGIVQDILAIWSLGLIPLAEHWKTVWADITNIAKDFWSWLSGVFGHDIEGFFTKTIPGWWDTSINFLKSNFITPFQNGFRDAWNWVVNNVFDPMKNFIVNTVPGWWNTAVSNIGTMFGKVKSVVQAPVKFVIDNVLDGLISVFDDITNAVGLGKPIPQVHPFGLAAGGKITAGTTPTADDVLVAVSKDETVLSARHSRMLSPALAALGVPGYAAGGKIGQNAPHPGVIGTAVDIGKIILALSTGNTVAATNAFVNLMGGGLGGAAGEMASILTAIPKLLVKDAIHFLLGQVGTSGSGIAEFAAQYLDKIPYVWGGTSLFTGADCSGFVQAIYHHFGINAPRTSEAQGAWVKRGPPISGGLAFYHSPAGGPDPGHVAIVRNANQVISQGGGLGPQLMPLHGMPLLWTGTPPGGFGTQPGMKTPGNVASWLEQAMAATAVPSWWLGPLEKIQSLETDSLPNMTTVINPNGGATGLMQVKPGTFAEFFKFPGGIFNPVTNAVAAIRHIEQAWNGSPLNIPGIGAPGVYQGYDQGGWMYGWPNMTGQPEAVLTPSESRAFVAQNTGNAHNLSDVVDRLETLISVAARSPAATAAGVSKAIGGGSRKAAYSLMYGAR